MTSVDELLRQAVSQCRRILEAFAALEGPLARGEHELLTERVGELEARQEEGRELDRALLERVDAEGLPARLLPLGREYRELLEQVARRHQELLDKARVHQALVAAELAELKSNQTALAGYRLPEDSRGRGLSGSY